MHVLDLFSCAGGASRGYQLAGHEVTGVDIDERPQYCGNNFVQGDAVKFAIQYAKEFDFIHASPPCQGFSTITPQASRHKYVNLIPEVREVLIASGKPFIIENVVTAIKQGPMHRDLMLCGEMFGLRVVRHRVFEFGNGFEVSQPKHIKHKGKTKGASRPCRSRSSSDTDWYYYGVYGWGDGPVINIVADWQKAMGIDWMTDRHDLAEALPPAYTQYIIENSNIVKS